MLLNVIWHFFSKVSSHWALGKILSVLKNSQNNGLGKKCILEVRCLIDGHLFFCGGVEESHVGLVTLLLLPVLKCTIMILII